jgi:hypothetical protein
LSIKIGRYDFEGPYISTERLRNLPGVYTILCPEDGKLSIIYVGESSEVKLSVEGHERRSCWQKKCSGTFMFSAYYTPSLGENGRNEIEASIRKQYEPPCDKS